jgi:hypothetical protein
MHIAPPLVVVTLAPPIGFAGSTRTAGNPDIGPQQSGNR